MSGTITVRVNEKIKAEAQALYESIGLDMSTAINIFLLKSIDMNGIPFNVSKSFPNKETLAAMDDAENGKNLSGPYKTMKELKVALNA
jgi:DNA-damage-inducible protein J